MTTIISRLYEDQATANSVVEQLMAAGHPAGNISTIAKSPNAHGAMLDAHVDRGTAGAYAEMMTGRRTLVVVSAPVTPFGAARNAMSIMNSAPSIPVATHSEDRYIREQPKGKYFVESKVLRKHPRFLTSSFDTRTVSNRATVSKALGWPLLTRNKTKHSVISGGKQIFPMPALKEKSGSNSAISGGKRFLYNPSLGD